MRQNFKFGRKYEVNNFTLFNPMDYDIEINNFVRSSAYYSPQGENGTSGSSGTTDTGNPQFAMTGIKKFYHKGKYPRPRNS